MKKLILSLLTLASLTACKKDIVEPVVSSDVNRLPKRVYYNSDSTFKETAFYGDFSYYENGLLKSFVSNTRPYLFKITYEYIGSNISKITYYHNDSIDNVLTYQYENNLFKSFFATNKTYSTPQFTYNYKNGDLDYILKKNYDGDIDSISVLNNSNETIFNKYESTNNYFRGSIRINKKSNAIIDSSNSKTSEPYYFINKQIALQEEIIDGLLISNPIKNFNKEFDPYLKKSGTYKLILNSTEVNSLYNFDGYERLTTFSQQYQLHNIDGSSQEVTNYTKIIY